MSFGAIGGSIAATVVGSALGGGSSGGTQTQTTQTSANPFSAGGGLFSTQFGPGVTSGPQAPNPFTQAQQAQLAALQGLSQQQIGGSVNRDPSLDRASNLDIERRAAQNTRNRGLTDADFAGTGLTPAMLAQFNQFNAAQGANSGVFGLNTTANPALQAIQDQNLSGANQLFGQSLDAFNNIGNFDPNQIAQNQFGLLNPILQDQFNQENLNLESRLFSQGRLGGTSGSQQQNALFDSQQDTQRKLLFDSLGIGMQSQLQQANIAGLFQGAGSNFLNNSLGIERAGLNQAQVAGGLSGARQSGSLSDGSLSPLATAGAGLLTSGLGGLSSAVGGLFQPSVGSTRLGSGNFQGPFNTGPR